jgi:hypothetical protein
MIQQKNEITHFLSKPKGHSKRACLLDRRNAHKSRHVLSPFTERRENDRHHIQALIKVFAEISLLHRFSRFWDGCRYGTNVYGSGRVTPEPFFMHRTLAA